MKRILVAPLNWGLGHATRSIPIINALIANKFEPVIASDGEALRLLQKEYPQLQTLELPSYNITYSKKANSFKLKLIKDSPSLLKTIKREKKITESIVESENISGIISDNRFGVRDKSIPSVFITHQLRVLSGSTTWLSSKLHQNIISKFDECWVPDHTGTNNLSGALGHIEGYESSIKYLGPLSRFEKQDLEKKYDLLVVLSGPEPQRSFLEVKLFDELQHFNGKICFVKGLIEKEQRKTQINHITTYNFMASQELEKALNESELVLSRSGYTSIMDYAKLEKKAFFIPTPGQFEQEYLAKRFEEEQVAPTCKQRDFKTEMLNEIENYHGFKYLQYDLNYKKLFGLF
ncbi:glycosyltransferase [Winogradskyella sp. J14-2]|uniref:glycosyltransferase n=1 Tax=Winogradskyella sp. J14-2 TaxID=1936080 RepID=UPI000972B1DD|nr:glycosyltransferase [Winogradskyella sp. J14-2]APY08118.1 glycosyltransferase [Winogradskyella sp. J14-2]